MSGARHGTWTSAVTDRINRWTSARPLLDRRRMCRPAADHGDPQGDPCAAAAAGVDVGVGRGEQLRGPEQGRETGLDTGRGLRRRWLGPIPSPAAAGRRARAPSSADPAAPAVPAVRACPAARGAAPSAAEQRRVVGRAPAAGPSGTRTSGRLGTEYSMHSTLERPDQAAGARTPNRRQNVRPSRGRGGRAVRRPEPDGGS